MFLGIEIGGTKLQLGVGPGDGTLKDLWRGVIDVAAGADGIRLQIEAAIPVLLARAGVKHSELRGVGIGFGGPIDDATRTVVTSHQVAGWDGFPLADWATGITGAAAVLGNDADVAGLGETLFGAGKGLSPIFYVTLGSGIGGGLVIDGQIFRGNGRGAAEIGHLKVEGGRHVLEEVASGWGIERQAQGAFGDARLTALDVARAAAAGDGVARGILHRSWQALAEALCHVIALLCPRRIVIGGGVSGMDESLLFEPLRQLVAERVFPPFAGRYEIVRAALGKEVVIHGALALARQHLETRGVP